MNHRNAIDWNAMSDDAFRKEVRSFVQQNYPDELRFLPHRPRWAITKTWAMKLVEKGWSAPNWPAKYGGMGLSPGKLLIFMDEQERWGVVAQPPNHGIVQLGPMLIRYGTEEQKATLLPGMRTYETRWVQGYSEPNAGSDLASLRTEAVLDGDSFVINGGKIWTSLALDATHIYLLARTESNTARKQEGISFLLVDLSLPGITVRGIKNIAGSTDFCEIRFENVRTPRENIVGEINKGWTLAKSVLGFERIHNGSPRRTQYAFHRLTALADERGLFTDTAFMQRYTELRLDVADLKAVYGYFAARVKKGEALGPDVSVMKILATETNQRITELMLETSGDHGLSIGTGGSDSKVDALSPFLFSRSYTLGSGTTEIQRNIVAKSVLNLPQ